MYEKIKLLIAELKAENEQRNKELNSPNISDYSHTAKVHMYNNTLNIIKRLEKIIE
jgi:hypothetical protein